MLDGRIVSHHLSEALSTAGLRQRLLKPIGEIVHGSESLKKKLEVR
jgi:hypothetical protein